MTRSREWSPIEEKIAESLPHLDVDEVWKIGGRIGRYQIIQFLIVTWYVASAGFHLLAYIFIGYEPPHTCNTVENITDHFDGWNASLDTNIEKCAITFHYGNQTVGDMDCVLGHNYSAPKDTSFLSEAMGLRLWQEGPRTAAAVVTYGWSGTGALLTQSADYIGRRKTLIISQVLMFVLTFSQAFLQHFWIFAALRLVTGAVQQGIVLSAWIYLVELFPTNRRFCLSCFDILSWAAHFLLLGAIAYVLRDYGWRTLEIALSFSGLHAIILFFFMEESLRWLIVKERTEDSVKLLKKIARVNRVPLEKILLADKRMDQRGENAELMSLEKNKTNGGVSNYKWEPVVQNGEPFEVSDVDTESNTKTSNTEGLCTFFKDPKLLFQSAIVWFSWFVNVLVYFGLYTMPSLTIKDRFWQYTLMAAMELPSALILFITLKKLKRKTIYITFHLLGGIVLLLSSILSSIETGEISDGGTLYEQCVRKRYPLEVEVLKMGGTGVRTDLSVFITILSLIGKVAIGTSFYFLFMYTPELFPTYMRNTGIGVASFCGRIGGIIAPFTFTLANAIPWAPGVVFGTCCIVVGVLVKFVSETSDKPLPQKTKDIVSWRQQVGPV